MNKTLRLRTKILALNEVNFEFWVKDFESVLGEFELFKGPIDYGPETGLLEPWAQWPSLFYSIDSKRLGVRELGQLDEVAKRHKPFWDDILTTENGSLVWGVMNATTEYSSRNIVIADPWSGEIDRVHKDFRDAVGFVKKFAGNYLDLSLKDKILGFGSLLRLHQYLSVRDWVWVVRIIARYGLSLRFRPLLFIAIYEYLMLKMGIKVAKIYQLDQVGMFFFNTFAHIQHHYWDPTDKFHRQCLDFGSTVLRDILSVCRSEGILDGYWLICNGLDQENCVGIEDWMLYRPKSHARLFERLLPSKTFGVREAMTNDGRLIFETDIEADLGLRALANWRVDNEPLFVLERCSNQIFYRPFSFRKRSKNSLVNNSETPERFGFFDEFVEITTRSGRHIQSHSYVASSEFHGGNGLRIHEIGLELRSSYGSPA